MYFPRSFLISSIWFFVESFDCILLPPNMIFALIEELRIINPTILYNHGFVNHLLKTKLVKEFGNHGKTIRYHQVGGKNQYYCNNIIFTDLQKFNFNLIGNHPTLIITQIQNEGDLDLINLSINTLIISNLISLPKQRLHLFFRCQ